MGDSHQMIVYHIGKIIRRITVRFDQHHIIQLGVVHRNVTINLIMECSGSLGRIVLADDVRHTGG